MASVKGRGRGKRHDSGSRRFTSRGDIEFWLQVFRSVTLSILAGGAIFLEWLPRLHGWEHTFMFGVFVTLFVSAPPLEIIRLCRTRQRARDK